MKLHEPKTYVHLHESGALRLIGTRIGIEAIVYEFREGRSPESIRQSYPILSLEEIYGAITFYLANKAEVDAYVKREEEHWRELLAEQDRNPSPLLQRIRAIKAARAKEGTT